MSKPAKPILLFLTCPEQGQTNVHFACISAFQQAHGDAIDIHLASAESVEKRAPDGVTFHSLEYKGLSGYINEAAGGEKAGKNALFDAVTAPYGIFASMKADTTILSVMHPELPSTYVAAAKDVERLLHPLQPTFVVVDHFFEPARDALVRLGVPFLRLSPNSLKEVGAVYQGLGALSWPSPASGYTYPLRFYQHPLNVLSAVFPLATPAISLVSPSPKPLLRRSSASRPWATRELPAIGHERLVCCGPIVRPGKPLREVDAGLYEWVVQGPVVLIALGSNFVVKEAYAKEMLGAIKELLAKREDVRVLWKLVKYGEYEMEGVSAVETGERLRVVEWLEADPAAILGTGQVVAFVNHGGSNSYHEGLAAGVPQVLLPAWLDCYDFAARLASLGNGVWGNKSSALTQSGLRPSCSRSELLTALLMVIGSTPDDPTALKFRARAKELAGVVTDGGKRVGREVAAERIWEEMRGVMEKKEMRLVEVGL
ncbi:hypothetical protein IAT38_003141 [Cryptococcus sp. DSM 104549]